MKKRDNDCQKVCLYCENAVVLQSDDDLLCKYKGIVSEDYVCRKYIYDPLKRQPKPKNEMPKLSSDELL